MDDAEESIARAPLPTKRTLHARANIPFQMLRFVSFSIRMLRMVIKGHE